MSIAKLPISRSAQRALIIAGPAFRAEPLNLLRRLGFEYAEADDPYAAMLQLSRKPEVYTDLVISLNSLYQEELAIIAAVKRRWPDIQVWLVGTDGRQAALAQAMRLGADGLVCEDGLQRTASAIPTQTTHLATSDKPDTATVASPKTDVLPAQEEDEGHGHEEDGLSDEPVLTAEELRALLQDQTFAPGRGRTNLPG